MVGVSAVRNMSFDERSIISGQVSLYESDEIFQPNPTIFLLPPGLYFLYLTVGLSATCAPLSAYAKSA